jgi:hypothetical protein
LNGELKIGFSAFGSDASRCSGIFRGGVFRLLPI